MTAPPKTKDLEMDIVCCYSSTFNAQLVDICIRLQLFIEKQRKKTPITAFASGTRAKRKSRLRAQAA
jgi:hypothetical protein